jgi:hypothetical protein
MPAPVFYCSLLLIICDFNAEEICLLQQKGQGEGCSRVDLFYCFNTLWLVCKSPLSGATDQFD